MKSIVRSVFIFVGSVYLSMLLLLLSACTFTETHGALTKEEVVDKYVRALEKKDERALLLLIPTTHNAKQAVHDKVEQLGGHPIRDLQAEYRSEFGPQMAMVTIQGVYIDAQGKDNTIKETIFLQQIAGRWYLILGRDESVPPPSRPSQP